MVVWTVNAARDLRHVHDFIASDSRFYARKVVDEILRRTAVLESFPEIGRVVPEIGRQDIRELILYSYRIIYRVRGSGDVEVLALLHARRDFPADVFDSEQE